VVLAVVGDPVDDRALDRHRAEDGERRAQPRLRLERAMGEHAVEADRHPEADEDVGDGEDGEVAGGDRAAPEQPQGDEEAGERQDDRHDGDAALERRRVRMSVGHGYKDARNAPGTNHRRARIRELFLA
jgi:hypothetical protein